MLDLKKAKVEIAKAKDIVIASHINPDGDSIGSLLSLGLGLRTLGKRVFMLSSDGVPQRYRFLPGAKLIKRRLKRRCDLAISVDCSNKEILGPAYEAFERSKRILAIDHHEFRRPFAHVRLIDKKAAAVGEMIYVLLNSLDVEITPSMAVSILTSIIVETNSFKLPNVRAYTFVVCSELLKRKVNLYRLVNKMFWSRSPHSAILSGICLSRIKFLKGGMLAWSIVRMRDFQRTKGKDEDVDIVANEMRAIEGVKIAVLFREKDRRHIRISLEV